MLATLSKLFLLVALILSVVCFALIILVRVEPPIDLPAVENVRPIAIDNIHIVTMDGAAVQRNRQILIEDGLIAHILPAGTTIDSDAKRVDGNDAYLLPGLFDMHAHVWDRKHQMLSLAYGVTTVRNMGGYPFHLRWKKELEDGKWLGSNLFSASPILNGRDHSDPLAHKVVDDPDTARMLVRRYNREGWDIIKVYESLRADVYDAIVDEAAQLGIPVAGHVPYDAIKDGYRNAATPLVTLEHVEELFDGPLNYQFDKARLYQVARKLKTIDATVTTTLAVFDQLTQIGIKKQNYVDGLPTEYMAPLMKFVTDNTAGKRWINADDAQRDYNINENDFLLQIVQVLYENKVNLVLGSDYGALYGVPGLSTHDEMSLLAKAGLSPLDILASATKNAAKSLKVFDRYGSIEVGKVADLVMVAENPLSDVSVLKEPIAVIKRGQLLNAKDLEGLEHSARKPSNALLTVGHLLEHLWENYL
ncbi:MAG: amidohydrolase family protein [Pseudomonadales bacterium]